MIMQKAQKSCLHDVIDTKVISHIYNLIIKIMKLSKTANRTEANNADQYTSLNSV